MTSLPTRAPAGSRCATNTALRSGGRRCDRLWCERAPAVVGVGVVVFIPAASPLERAAPSARWRSSGYVGGRTQVSRPPRWTGRNVHPYAPGRTPRAAPGRSRCSADSSIVESLALPPALAKERLMVDTTTTALMLADGPWHHLSGPPFPFFLIPLVWFLLLAGIVTAVFWSRRRRELRAGLRAGEAVLAERFARGEIGP